MGSSWYDCRGSEMIKSSFDKQIIPGTLLTNTYFSILILEFSGKYARYIVVLSKRGEKNIDTTIRSLLVEYMTFWIKQEQMDVIIPK